MNEEELAEKLEAALAKAHADGRVLSGEQLGMLAQLWLREDEPYD